MTVLIETERLVLRSWTLSDLDGAFNLWSDPDVMRFVGNGLPQNDREEARTWLEQAIAYEEKNGFCRWAVEDRISGQLTGCCGFLYQDKDTEVDLGYYILREHWGKGYATEIAAACLNYGFEDLKFTEIVASVDVRHVRSRRILEKLGFDLVKTIANDDGTVDDIFAISRRN